MVQAPFFHHSVFIIGILSEKKGEKKLHCFKKFAIIGVTLSKVPNLSISWFPSFKMDL